MTQEITKNIKGKNIRNIRHFILSLLYQNGISSVKVPSSPELARMFGVARRTACMALEGMIKEGYLIGKVGIGTFTNPKMRFKIGRTPQLPLIAVGLESCSHFYFDTRIGDVYARLLDAVLQHGGNIYPLIHSAPDFESLADEIEKTHIDGLILHSPQCSEDEINILKKLEIPIATIGKKYAGCGAVLYDEKGTIPVLSDLFTSRLPANGTVLYAYTPNSPQERIIRGSIDSLKKVNNLRYSHLTLDDDASFEDNLTSHIRQYGLPDALVIGWRYAWLTSEVLMDFSNDSFQKCRILICGLPSNPLPFTPTLLHADTKTMAEEAAKDIMNRIAAPLNPPITVKIPMCVDG